MTDTFNLTKVNIVVQIWPLKETKSIYWATPEIQQLHIFKMNTENESSEN